MWKRIPLLLAPPAAEGGDNTPPAGQSLGISDIVGDLDIPAELKNAIVAEEKPAGGAPTAEEKAATELAARAKAAGKTPEEQKKFEDAEAAKAGGKDDEIAKPDFNADQQAWLDLRAKATTPEEIAELDKEMPTFSQEQADWINAEADKIEKAEGGEAETEDAPDFTDEQKPYVEKLTTQLTETKAKLAEEESKRSELEAKVTELENAPPPVAGNLHPLAITDKAEDIDTYEDGLEKFISWGRKNWDGAEEVKGDDGKVTQRAYTAAEIREAVTRRENELRKTIPAARAALQQRQAEVAAAHKIYPAFTNVKSAESQIAVQILKQYPFIKAMPGYMTVIGDAIAGERARLAAAKGKKKTALRIAPKVAPKAGAGGGRSRVIAGKGGKPATDKVNADAFLEAKKKHGGDEKAALMEILS